MEQHIALDVASCGYCTMPGGCEQLDRAADSYVIDLTGGIMSSTHAACILKKARAAGAKPVHLRLNRRNAAIAHVLGMDHMPPYPSRWSKVPRNRPPP